MDDTRKYARMLCWLAGLLPLLLGSGCDVPAMAPSVADDSDVWEAFFVGDSRVGYGHTTTKPTVRDGQPLLEVTTENQLSIVRFSDKVEQHLSMTSLETPDGELVSLSIEANLGPVPLRIEGRVEQGNLLLTTTTQGQTQTSKLPWKADIGGFRAVEQSLLRRPMIPGEKRQLSMFMPLVNNVAAVDLEAQHWEETPLLAGKKRLLSIKCTSRLPDGTQLVATNWCDQVGRVQKSWMAALNQFTYRTTREDALSRSPGKSFDLGTGMIVKLARPLPGAQRFAEIDYRVELADADPAKTFSQGPTQQVQSLGPHSAKVSVRRIGSSDPVEESQKSPQPDRSYLDANNMLQIDDARVKAMAAEARGTATDPLEVAGLLERYVKRAMTTVDFTQAFATAAEVAQSRQGDCTEHAVLLAALARASGIPSRVAIGLVYVESAGGFGYHMWTEMYVNGRWTAWDATLGQGGISAAYLKLTDSNLAGTSAFAAFLPVAQVLGQLKIEVLATR